MNEHGKDSQGTPMLVRKAPVAGPRWLVAAVGGLVALALALLLTLVRTEPEVITISTGSERVVEVTQTAAAGSPLLIMVLIGLLGAVSMMLARRRRSTQAPVLGGATDVSAAGPLAEALWSGDRYVRTEAEEALISLLPRLKFSDGHLLTDNQRACLHRALQPPRRKREADLIVAIIGALTQVGDEKAVAHVARLSEERARNPLQEQVQAFAAESLPALRQSVETGRTMRTLVRPADSSGQDAQTLLRPAAPGDQTPADQLVRPSSLQG